MHCALHPSPQREAGRLEIEEACGRCFTPVCGKDILAICLESRFAIVTMMSIWKTLNSHRDGFIAYDPLAKQKAPRVLADAVTWIDTALLEFGIAGLSLRSLIEFLKTALKNSNAAVRISATRTLVTVKLFAGPSTWIV